jgi:type IV pilus assembly protein PilA
MTASTLHPQLQTTLIRKLNHSSSRKKNILQKGFTLVELMIVIVIVGILSAVALPNFLSQSAKAKVTEPLGKVSAGLKQAQSLWVETGTFTGVDCDDIGFTATSGAYTENGWTYTCTPAADGSSLTMTASGVTGGANANLGLTGCTITGATGVITACTKDTDASS